MGKFTDQLSGSTASARFELPFIAPVTPSQLFKPFVLKCPICMAPTEMGETHCQYCKAPMAWEPVHSLSRDDQHYRYLEPLPEPKTSKCVLGFGPTAVHPHALVVLQMTPLRPFRGHRIFIGPEYASNFQIADFRVGVNSQFASLAPIPASRCAVGEGLEMHMDDAMVGPGQYISLHVENISPHASTIAGLISGETLA